MSTSPTDAGARAGLALRYGVGALLAAALTVLPVSACAVAVQAPADTGVWSVETLGDGLYATVTRPEHGYSQFANSLIVVGDSAVAVVDSRESPEAARALIEVVRGLTDLPVVALINTHWHWDHVNGNQAFVEAFPDVAILGHPETARLMPEEGRARLDERIAALEGRRERLLRWLENGARDDGRKLTEEEVGQATEIARSDSAKVDRFREVVVTPPTQAVADSVLVDLGGRTIVVLHPGPAHTPGDLVVIVPDARLAYLGDLIEHGPPFFGDGTVSGSRDALARLAERDVDRYLPAHGPADGGDGLFSRQMRLLDAVVAAPIEAAADSTATDGAARTIAADHWEAVPGFQGPEDPRLLEYLAGLLREVAAETH